MTYLIALIVAAMAGALCVRRAYQSTRAVQTHKTKAYGRWAYLLGGVSSIALIWASQLQRGFAFPLVIFLLLAGALAGVGVLAARRKTSSESSPA